MRKKETLYYTGVGARVTPEDVQLEMERIAGQLFKKNYILRSGGQPKGADGAWSRGAPPQGKQIFKPPTWQRPGDYHTLPAAYIIAARHRKKFDELEQWHKDLLARNVHAALGPKLDDPSEFLLAWTECGRSDDRAIGGTGHTIRVANAHGIPVFNMNNPVQLKYIYEHLLKRE